MLRLSGGCALPVKGCHLGSKAELNQGLGWGGGTKREGGALLRQLSACVSPSYSREQLCPGPHVSRGKTGSELTGRKSDSCDFRKATWSPCGTWRPLQFFLKVRENLRGDPILQLGPSGGRGALTKPEQNSGAREASPSTWQVLKSPLLWGCAFGAWKAGREELACLAQFPDETMNTELESWELGAW